MRNPVEKVPESAVAGLAEMLLALGDELRSANHQIGEFAYADENGDQVKQPVLFLAGATVELSIQATATAGGGVKVWVVNAEAGATLDRVGKVTVQLNPGDQPFGLGSP